ncbi:MAG: GDSL-type esterase/lipase family protein [Bacteroidota bacterium]|nr:GDSL-type esterase/lipase family protein [Bacteroidota bacterium]
MAAIKIKYVFAFSLLWFWTYAQVPLSESTAPDSLLTPQFKIVMLGNSITHGGNWPMLLNRNDVAERGVVSDVLTGFYKRVQEIYKLKPKIIFTEGGINDIYNNDSAEIVFGNYKKLIEDILMRNIKVVVQSTLYVSSKYNHYAEKNKVVSELNALLKQYCKEKQIEFIDLNPLLSPEGTLKSEFTYDGVHLKGPAYLLWAEQVNGYLTKINF